MKVHAHNTIPDPRTCHRSKHIACAAANLEKAASRRCELIGERHDEFAAGDEPEVVEFDIRQKIKGLGIETVNRVRNRRRDQRNTVFHGRCITTPATCPAKRPNRASFED
jgi:hypothetical protein